MSCSFQVKRKIYYVEYINKDLIKIDIPLRIVCILFSVLKYR